MRSLADNETFLRLQGRESSETITSGTGLTKANAVYRMCARSVDQLGVQAIMQMVWKIILRLASVQTTIVVVFVMPGIAKLDFHARNLPRIKIQ